MTKRKPAAPKKHRAENCFVLRTDKLGAPHYFAGLVGMQLGHGITLTTIPFMALDFATRAEAEECITDIGAADWLTISELGPFHASANLATPA